MKRLALFLAGLLLATTAIAGDDVILIGRSTYVGGDIDITEPTEGSVRAAGGEIRLSAPIGGNAHLAGGNVTVTGAVKGKLRVAGGHVTVDGPVGGDVSVAAGKLVIGPNARIDGRLRFHGGDLERDPAALVKGGVEESAGRQRGNFHFDAQPFGRSVAGWIWTAGLMVLAALIAGALPGPMRRMGDELVAHPWHAPLLGFIAITCIPVAAVLVMITIIGIPLGLLALLGYAALLLIGYVCISIVVGGLLLQHFKADVAGETAWRVGVAALAVLVVSLLARIPFLGGFVAFAALLVGVGLIVAVVMRRTPKEAPPAAA
jgi:cytoskeletal protein CcmA (bactofilin family)